MRNAYSRLFCYREKCKLYILAFAVVPKRDIGIEKYFNLWYIYKKKIKYPEQNGR